MSDLKDQFRVVAPRREGVMPIWGHNIPIVAWRLLWWLICRMDPITCEVTGGWRSRAAKELRVNRQWLGRCAQHLQDRKLIETAKNSRTVKVVKARLAG